MGNDVGGIDVVSENAEPEQSNAPSRGSFPHEAGCVYVGATGSG
jgi:hypothetical protein